MENINEPINDGIRRRYFARLNPILYSRLNLTCYEDLRAILRRRLSGRISSIPLIPLP